MILGYTMTSVSIVDIFFSVTDRKRKGLAEIEMTRVAEAEAAKNKSD